MIFLAWIRRCSSRAGALLAPSVALLSCAGPPGDTPPAPATTDLAATTTPAVIAVTPAPRGPAAHPLVGLARPGEAGSRVALGKLGTRRLAFVADEDDHALHTIDLEAGLDIARTPLAAAPSEVVIGLDGRVYVGLRSAAAIAVLGSTGAGEAPLVEESRLATSAEPVGLALTPDGATLLVTTGISHELKAISLVDGQPRFTVSLPREPRSLVVVADGSRAFVAHAAGSTVSAVDLASKAHPIKSVDVAGGLEPARSYCGPPPRFFMRQAIIASPATAAPARAATPTAATTGSAGQPRAAFARHRCSRAGRSIPRLTAGRAPAAICASTSSTPWNAASSAPGSTTPSSAPW